MLRTDRNKGEGRVCQSLYSSWALLAPYAKVSVNSGQVRELHLPQFRHYFCPPATGDVIDANPIADSLQYPSASDEFDTEVESNTGGLQYPTLESSTWDPQYPDSTIQADDMDGSTTPDALDFILARFTCLQYRRN
jgi:hypothetical protein